MPPEKPRPKRRLTGSVSGSLNSRDVKVSAYESAGWSGLIGGVASGIEMIGYELRDSIPWLALSFPMEIVAATVIVAFTLIFVSKLWLQKRSDNRPDRRRL